MGTEFTARLGIPTPLICGAMYPCSNPELVAAVSEAGGIGVVQPLSLTYVHGYDFREGLRYIRSLTREPIGVNLIIERSSRKYLERVAQWLRISLEENIPFFVTALGDPGWVVKQATGHNVTVYHDVTEKRFAQKAADAGVDGFICVNNKAGGHAGKLSPEQLIEDIGPFSKPMICAGGIGCATEFRHCLDMGYAGAQLGTRFIASKECTAPDHYKQAILDARSRDIVLTEKISGVPVSIINTPAIEKTGLHAGPFARWMLRGRKTKHWMRTIYTLQSLWKLKASMAQGMTHNDIYQAGKSVECIHDILPAATIIEEFSSTLSTPLEQAQKMVTTQLTTEMRHLSVGKWSFTPVNSHFPP